MRESLFETLVGLAVVLVAGFFLVLLAVAAQRCVDRRQL
jgi:hypothetical protein